MSAALVPMATCLAAEVIELSDDRRCINVLLAARFDRRKILAWLRDAQEIAREMRATLGEVSFAGLHEGELHAD